MFNAQTFILICFGEVNINTRTWWYKADGKTAETNGN